MTLKREAQRNIIILNMYSWRPYSAVQMVSAWRLLVGNAVSSSTRGGAPDNARWEFAMFAAAIRGGVG